MDIRQINYFLTICRTRGFTSAAQELYITQQALSKSIAQLEFELGAPLFIRSRQGLTLTALGIIFKKTAEEVMASYHSLEESIHAYQDNIERTVTCGVSSGMEAFFTPEISEAFHTLFPLIKLQFNIRDSETCKEKVERGDYDAAIVQGPVEDQGFDSIPLKRNYMVAIINQNNPLFGRSVIAIDELKEQALISTSETNRKKLVALCRSHHFEPNIIYSTTYPSLIYRLCSENNYIGFSAAHLAERQAKDPRISLARIQDNAYIWEMSLITRSERLPKPTCQDLIRFMCSYFKTNEL